MSKKQILQTTNRFLSMQEYLFFNIYITSYVENRCIIIIKNFIKQDILCQIILNSKNFNEKCYYFYGKPCATLITYHE